MYQAFVYVINEIILLFSLVLLLRFQVSLSNCQLPPQIHQIIAKLSNWCLQPLRLTFQKFRLEWATVFIVFILQVIFSYLFSSTDNSYSILIYSIFRTFSIYLQLLTYLLIAQVIFSWLQPQHEMYHSLQQLCAPFLKPLQQRIPLIANIDFSPILAFLILQFISRSLGV